MDGISKFANKKGYYMKSDKLVCELLALSQHTSLQMDSNPPSQAPRDRHSSLESEEPDAHRDTQSDLLFLNFIKFYFSYHATSPLCIGSYFDASSF